MRLEVLGETSELRAFEPAWQQFLRRLPAPTPLQTPEWLLTWWTHFGRLTFSAITPYDTT